MPSYAARARSKVISAARVTAGGETFVGDEVLRDGMSESAEAPRGEQVEAMRSEVDRARRAFDDAVDGSPERVGGDLPFGAAARSDSRVLV